MASLLDLPAVTTPKIRRPKPKRHAWQRAIRTGATSVLIDGRETTDTDLLAGSLRLDLPLGRRGKFSCQLVNPPVPPEMDMDVLFSLDGTPMFGGIIVDLLETTGSWTVTASDNQAITDTKLINAISPAGTLAAVLAWMVADLTREGFTLSAAQAAGPTLPELAWPMQSFSAAFAQLATLTGWTLSVSPTRVIRMFPGDAVPAPFALDEDTLQDLTVRRARDTHATHVWVRFGSGEGTPITWATTSDGTTRRYHPPYSVGTPPNQVTIGTAPTDTTLPVMPLAHDSGYLWDSTTQELVIAADTAVPATGTAITFTFVAAWPSFVVATDPAAFAQYWVMEVIDYPDVFDVEAAQQLAEGELRKRLGYPRQLAASVYQPGLLPGMSTTVQVPLYGLDAGIEALVTNVRLRHANVQADGEPWWEFRLDLIEGLEGRSNWLDFWRADKAATGGTGSSVTGTIPGGGGTPGPPGATYLDTDLGGSRTTTRTGSGPVIDWMPVLVEQARLSDATMTVYGELAILAGSGTVRARLMRFDVPTATWVEVARDPSALSPAVGTFVWFEFTAAATAGRHAYRLEWITSSSTALVAGVGHLAAH